MLQFVVYKSPASGYRFILQDSHKGHLLRSLPYSDQSSCLEGVEEFRRNIESDACFAIWNTFRGECFFNYHDERGDVLATSDIFSSVEELFDHILVIRESAKHAPCQCRTLKKAFGQMAA